MLEWPSSTDNEDELMDILATDEASLSLSWMQRSGIEARLVQIAQTDYDTSKARFESRPGLLTFDEPDIQMALLEEARHQHTIEADKSLDVGLFPSDCWHRDDDRLFPVPVSGLAERLGQFDLGDDWFDLSNPEEDSSKLKRRKTIHHATAAVQPILSSMLVGGLFDQHIFSAPLTPTAKPEGRRNKRKHRRSHSAPWEGKARVDQRGVPNSVVLDTPRRSQTPPPTGSAKKAPDGRVIIRRGPRGKYTCGRCGAARAGHTCHVKMARSVECQVDLAITASNVPLVRISTLSSARNFTHDATLKVMRPRKWVGVITDEAAISTRP